MKHKVNWHLDRGEIQHHTGDVIEMDAESAAHLVKCGVLTPIAEEDDSQGATPQGETSSKGEPIAPSKLAKSSKATLVQYAAERFGVSFVETEMTRDAMLAKIAELATAKGEK